jgi:hypothetical protein
MAASQCFSLKQSRNDTSQPIKYAMSSHMPTEIYMRLPTREQYGVCSAQGPQSLTFYCQNMKSERGAGKKQPVLSNSIKEET